MAQSGEVLKIKQRIYNEYEHLSESEVDAIFDIALADFMRYSYPFDGNRPSVENVVCDFCNTQWMYKRMLDVLSRAGGLNLTSYKENGLSLTYASSMIDPQLVRELVPKASVPK